MRKLFVFALALLPSMVMADGAATYNTFCVTCHGATGAGDGVAAAALNPKPASFADAAFWAERDDAFVKKVIKEGGAAVGKSPLMAPFGASIDDAKLDELVAYLKTMQK